MVDWVEFFHNFTSPRAIAKEAGMPSGIEVCGLYVAPVKSMQPIDRPWVELDAFGVVGDRRFMVVRPDGRFLSQREVPGLATMRAYQQPGHENYEIHFRASNGDRFPHKVHAHSIRDVVCQKTAITADDQGNEVSVWLSHHLHVDCRLVHASHSHKRFALPGNVAPVAYVDDAPLLITSEESLAHLNTRIVAGGKPGVSMNRFRPTLVVRGAGAFAEDKWRRIRIVGAEGVVTLEWMKRCQRCTITTIDQTTGLKPNGEPLVTLARMDETRGPGGVFFGSYYRHTSQGRISLGDKVEIDE